MKEGLSFSWLCESKAIYHIDNSIYYVSWYDTLQKAQMNCTGRKFLKKFNIFYFALASRSLFLRIILVTEISYYYLQVLKWLQLFTHKRLKWLSTNSNIFFKLICKIKHRILHVNKMSSIICENFLTRAAHTFVNIFTDEYFFISLTYNII